MSKIYAALDREESYALLALSKKEKRDPRMTAALLIREGLESRGLLQPIDTEQEIKEYWDNWEKYHPKNVT